MATTTQIHIRCDNARRDARELRRYSDLLRYVIRRYESLIEATEYEWEGQSARQFVSEAKTRIRKMQRVSDRLDDLATAIERTADIYRREELAKIRAQKMRRR